MRKSCILYFSLIFCFVFLSCQKKYETIDRVYYECGNEEVLFIWFMTDGERSILEIDISPKTREMSTLFPMMLDETKNSDNNYFLFTNLENGKEYTITLTNYNPSGDFISKKTIKVTPSSEIDTYKFNQEKPFIVVPFDSQYVTLKNVNNKLITFANLNTGIETIESQKERMIEGLLQRNRSCFISSSTYMQGDNEIHFGIPRIRLEKNNKYRQNSLSRSIQGSQIDLQPEFSIDIMNPKINEDKASLFVDTDSRFFETTSDNDTNYVELKEFTLRGVGKKDNNILCLVWVDDECYSEVNVTTGKQINNKLAQNLANAFVDYYLIEREIAGKESDEVKIVKGTIDNIILENMEIISKTGNIVNLVLYDLADDYEKENNIVQMGYFYDKDYYTLDKDASFTFNENDILSKSNVGKFIYLDAPTCNYFLNNLGKGEYKNEIGKPSSLIISTMIHEIQHIIHYGKNNNGEIWYDEMLSMLMEDVFYNDLQEKYNLHLQDSSQNRLSEFNKYYLYDWTSKNFEYKSYAPSYAFGAWMVRNYGGVNLLKELCHNQNSGFDAIIDSIEKTSNMVISKKMLLEQFLISCAIHPDNLNEKYPAFNKATDENLLIEGHRVGFKPINLYSESFTQKEINGGLPGPVLYDFDVQMDIPANSFILKYGLLSNKDEISLLIPTNSNIDEQFYIFVQDYFE